MSSCTSGHVDEFDLSCISGITTDVGQIRIKLDFCWLLYHEWNREHTETAIVDRHNV
ncbi:hypothetical protein D3C86_1094440 [compost metagenome]